MDTEKTKVIFRKYCGRNIGHKYTIIALFPEVSYRHNYMTGSYMHIGQHGDADYNGVIASTRPASPEEYAELKAELESLGYNLAVRKRAKIIYK